MARPRPGIRPGVAPRFVEVSKPPPASQPAQDAPPTPSNVTPFAAPKPDQVDLTPLSVEDVDRLWDWVRGDQVEAEAFLGQSFANSRELFMRIAELGEMERNGQAAMFSIREGTQLLGFVLVHPIVRTSHPLGTLSVYLDQEARPRLKAILPHLLHDVNRIMPDVNLCVVTQRGDWSALLESVGFTAHTVLTRPSTSTGAEHDRR